MSASEALGFPGQLDVVPGLGTVALAGASYLVYPHARHDAAAAAARSPTVCLVVRNASTALRATLRRLADPSLPAHRLVVIDGGSDDWSFSDAIAHVARSENAIVYRSPRDTTLGALHVAALELAGNGIGVLTPLHPELAAAALAALPQAIELADDILGALPGGHVQLLPGDAAANLPRSGANPLLALRGPVDPPPELARATTLSEVSLALADVLRRGHCAIAELPAIPGWRPPSMPPQAVADASDTVDTTRFWPGAPPLRLGQEGAFTFLVVTSWEAGAAWNVAVEAYVRTFTAPDRVSLAIVVVGPLVPPEDEAGAEILAVIAAAQPGSDDDLPDISLHTTPSVAEHLPAIYTGADCLVLADSERSALEAMAAGLPSIAPTGAPDVVQLGRAMAAAAADPAAGAARGAEARRRAIRLSAIDEQALDRPEEAL